MVALQEIRWNDEGMLDIQDTIIFYGECNKNHQFGTGFALHKNLVPSVREFKSIKPRISVVRSPHIAVMAVKFYCLSSGGKIVSGLILTLLPQYHRYR